MEPSVIAMIITLVLVVVGAVWRLIDWRSMAVKWVGNDPRKGQIYIKAGHDVRTVEGVRTKMFAKTQTYRYIDTDKQAYTIVIPGDKSPQPYPYDYIRGRRIIGMQDGHVVASPLGFMTDDECQKYNEGLTDLSLLSEGVNTYNAMKSVKQSHTPSWITWVVIIAVVVGAYFVYRNYFADEPIPESPTQQQGEIPPDLLERDM